MTHSFRMDFCSLAASNKKLCIMKRVLSILFLFLVLGSSVKAQLDFGFKEIVFTQKSDDRDMSGQSSSTSPEDAPKTRSVVLQPVYAYLDNGEITVYFEKVFPTVAADNGPFESVHCLHHNSSSVIICLYAGI